MIGLGTIVNCGAIIAGTTLGVFLKGGLPRRFETTIMQALGLCTFFIGIGGAVAGLVTIEDGALSTQHTMLLVLSLVIGALIGEALDIETRLNDFGTWCQTRFAGGGEDGKFVEGHVPAEQIQLLAKRPDLRGLAVPGMPMGSPGMEMGDHKDAYQVIGLTRDGTDEVVANYP